MAHLDRINKYFDIMDCSIKSIPLRALNFKENKFVINFIRQNKELSDKEFKGKAHYLFIDGKDGRDSFPKHIQIIEVLMSICSTA